MRLIAALLLISASLTTAALAQTYVPGYMRSDGTYVPPHYRSAPDRSYNNNWSVTPNVNPYSGQQGTRPPTLDDRPPPSLNFNSGSRRSRY